MCVLGVEATRGGGLPTGDLRQNLISDRSLGGTWLPLLCACARPATPAARLSCQIKQWPHLTPYGIALPVM